MIDRHERAAARSAATAWEYRLVAAAIAGAKAAADDAQIRLVGDAESEMGFASQRLNDIIEELVALADEVMS